jgi:hypothetical protein
MAAAIAATPASGTHLITAFNFAVTGVSSNDSTAYDSTKYPSEPALVYYISVEATGQDSLVSPRFTPAEAGTFAWYDVIVPAATTWSAVLRKDSDDSSVATASVVVS